MRSPEFGKVRLTIEYDGTNYCGWQRQNTNPQPSIQETLEDYLFKLFGQKIDAIAAGRTDAGVHALNQVVHFIPPREVRTYNFIHAAVSLLPPDITIKKAELMPGDFHAQYQAEAKTYVYKIWNEPAPSAVRFRNSLWVRKPLPLEELNRACEYLVGEHDFNAFRSEGTPVRSTVRRINWARFVKNGDFIEFQVNGNGFLKQMVRNIVGTFLQLRLQERPLDDIKAILESRDRKQAGFAAQPQGLHLLKVFYPKALENKAVLLDKG